MNFFFIWSIYSVKEDIYIYFPFASGRSKEMEAVDLCIKALKTAKQLYDTLGENWTLSKRLLERCLMFEQFLQERHQLF